MATKFRHNSASSDDHHLDNNNGQMAKSPSAHNTGTFNLMPPPSQMTLSNSQTFNNPFQLNLYQNYPMQMSDPNRSPHAVNQQHFKYINFKENNQNLDVSPDDVKMTLAQPGFDTSQTGSVVATRALQYQTGNPRDAMLSAINYTDQEMLPDASFDAAVTSSLPQLDAEGILGTISSVNEMRLPENPGADSFDLFEEPSENYLEPQQDLTISPHSYQEANTRFGLPENESSNTGDSLPQEPASLPPKPRGKGRPRSSGSPGRTAAQCQQCGKTFSNSSALAKHKLTHSDERKYVCKLCSKAFKRMDHLNGHMMTHRSKKPYECKFESCDKSYCDARSLRRHYENHHNQTPEQASAGVTAAQSMPPPPLPPSQFGGQNGDSSSHYPQDSGGRIQYAPPPSYNASPHTSPSFNTGNSQGQFFQFDQPYHGNQDGQSSWQQQHQQQSQDSQGSLFRISQYVNNQIGVGQNPGSGETSPGYQQQFSPISPAPGAHPTSPLQQHPSQRGTWMAPHFQQPMQKLVECTLCQRKFKNIPALNGHMRLHGGYFKKDPIKTDDKLLDESSAKEPVTSGHSSQAQPTHTSSVTNQLSTTHSELQAALKHKLHPASDPSSQEVINTIATSLAAMSQAMPLQQFSSFQPPSFVAPNHMSASHVLMKPSITDDAQVSLDLNLESATAADMMKLGDLASLSTYEKDKQPEFEQLMRTKLDNLPEEHKPQTGANSPKTVNEAAKSKPSTSYFTPIVLPSSTPSRVSNGARHAPVPRGGKPANYWKKEKYLNPEYKKHSSQAFTFSKEDTLRSRQQLQKDLFDYPKPQVKVTSPVTPSERKRHVSADPDKFTSPRSSLTSPGSLSTFLSENRDPLHPGRRRRDSEKYLRSPRYERSPSIEDGFVRPRSSTGGVFREPFRPHSRSEDAYSRSDGAIAFRSVMSGRGRKKHRPEPLIIPPHMNNCGFQSRLRSPRLWEGGEKKKVSPPPYTPPPMLSPVRSGSGLFWSLHPMRPVTPASAPHTPRMSLSRRNSLASSMSEKVLQEVKEVEEPQLPEELEPLEVEEEEEPPPETDVQPHVNIGIQYQADVPAFIGDVASALDVKSPEVMVCEPDIFKDLSESDVQYFQDFACCAAIRHSGMNKEYALHLLYKHKGNITDALLDLMNTEPVFSKEDTLLSYKYNETSSWSTAEIEAYNAAIGKHDKDFFKIGNEIGSKSTKQCVEFYYLWKKCCPDEYKRSRILRRRREQDELYNLRQRQDPPLLAKEDESDSESDSSKSDDESANNSDASSTTGSVTTMFACDRPECTATFSSKQALSGHSRVHSQAKPEEEAPPPEVKKVERRGRPPGSTNKHPAPPKPLSEGTSFPCKLCEKVFFKVKSRNAHMKSHRQKEEKERQEKLRQQALRDAMETD